jgi:L-asparaginase
MRVAIVPAALGQDDALLRAVPQLGYDGLVVDAMGGGHVPGHLAELLESIAAQIPVVLSSRTGAPVLSTTYGFPGSERDLLARGLINAGYLDAPKARVLLMLLLERCADRGAVRSVFDRFRLEGTAA